MIKILNGTRYEGMTVKKAGITPNSEINKKRMLHHVNKTDNVFLEVEAIFFNHTDKEWILSTHQFDYPVAPDDVVWIETPVTTWDGKDDWQLGVFDRDGAGIAFLYHGRPRDKK